MRANHFDEKLKNWGEWMRKGKEGGLGFRNSQLAGLMGRSERAEAGCINYDFHVDAADPCVFVFYENWTDRAALDTHLAMPHLQPLFLQLDRLLACPVDIRPLTMLSAWVG